MANPTTHLQETETQKLVGQFIKSWMRLLEFWDPSILEHSQRVARFAVQLAQKRGWRSPDLEELERGSLLHDLGKICIPPSILLSPGPLSEEEWTTVKRHPIYGYEILKQVDGMDLAGGVVLCHHENWNGSGYPRQLHGEQIPPGARIVAVAEVWDALTSNPADRASWSKDRVFNYIRDQSGRKFDPAVVEAFLGMTLM